MSGNATSSRVVLIVEDRPSVASVYRNHLEANGFACELACDHKAARAQAARSAPYAVLLSLELPGAQGADLIGPLSAAAPSAAIIVIAANASINAAVDAVRAGAWDYLVSPVSRNRLLTTLANAGDRSSCAVQPASQPRSAVTASPQAGRMIGSSSVMAETRRQIAAIAASSAPAFITGESGTGKELCAEAIHAGSPRTGKPFVALNCGAIPRDLMESEIFGHLKGAFTGAISDREGAAAAADGGTLFLDEICEMDLALQTKLLRFLQTGTIQPVGSAHTRKVDIRVVCATNRDPHEEVAQGRFREDLFFRLHVLPVRLAPLRERGNDVIELADTFLRHYAHDENKRFTSFCDTALDLLKAHRWPGNVRELQNVIRQAIVLNDGELLEADMLPAHVGNGHQAALASPATPALDGRLLWQIERDVIEAAIASFAGSIPKAAQALGISPSTIYRKRESWQAIPA
ncbi:MAG: sigma-54 dependent transcriptional regulator [Anderseniella sp.]|jgi:two-component system repressor protein LuxO|nr:sigma-54 dependent transcriptional regulator [Anderseniella sp.]